MKAATFLILTGIFAMLASGMVHSGMVYRVGPGCAFATIQAAVDAIPFVVGHLRGA